MTRSHFALRIATAFAVTALCGVALAQDPATPPAIGFKDTFQTNYTNALLPSLPWVTLTNGGTNTVPSLVLFGEPPIASADICVNIYTFKPDSTFINCCSCKVPSNGTLTLTGSLLYGAGANAIAATGSLVKLMTSVAKAPPAVCDPTVVPAGTGVPGGFGSGLGATAFHSIGLSGTETQFLPQPLGSAEVNKIVNLCKASAARCSCSAPPPL